MTAEETPYNACWAVKLPCKITHTHEVFLRQCHGVLDTFVRLASTSVSVVGIYPKKTGLTTAASYPKGNPACVGVVSPPAVLHKHGEGFHMQTVNTLCP